jgi:hypothetical protein
MQTHKTIAAAIALMMALTAFAAAPASAASKISIQVDGIELKTDVNPMIIADRTMVPVRAVTEAVGCKVDWFAEDQRIVIYSPAGGDSLLVMHAGDSRVTVNSHNGDTGAVTGEVVTIDAPPVIVNNRTLVPLRFIAETMSFGVDWDGDSQTVFLYSAYYGGDANDPWSDVPETPLAGWAGVYIGDGIAIEIEVPDLNGDSFWLSVDSMGTRANILDGTATLYPDNSMMAEFGEIGLSMNEDYGAIDFFVSESSDFGLLRGRYVRQ